MCLRKRPICESVAPTTFPWNALTLSTSDPLEEETLNDDWHLIIRKHKFSQKTGPKVKSSVLHLKFLDFKAGQGLVGSKVVSLQTKRSEAIFWPTFQFQSSSAEFKSFRLTSFPLGPVYFQFPIKTDHRHYIKTGNKWTMQKRKQNPEITSIPGKTIDSPTSMVYLQLSQGCPVLRLLQYLYFLSYWLRPLDSPTCRFLYAAFTLFWHSVLLHEEGKNQPYWAHDQLNR